MTERSIQHPRQRSRWRWPLRVVGLGTGLLIGAELFARLVLGLGDPPLFMRDPSIEYLYKPSREYRYLHHTVRINSHSMRAAEFPDRKSSPDEFRVMVIGDSIVAGGGRVDQSDLATERLRDALAQRLGRPVVVGAIAAGSWGPPNELAYIKRFGLFQADIVIVVLNTGDVDDVPGLEPIGAAWPERMPLLAIQEPLRRGLERFAPGLSAQVGLLDRRPAPPYEVRLRESAEALRGIFDGARDAGAQVGCLVYWTLPELRAPNLRDRAAAFFQLTAESHVFTRTSTDGPQPFTDDAALFLPGDLVHPSAVGHARLSSHLEAIIDSLVTSSRPAGSPAPSGTSDISPANSSPTR